MNTDRKFDVDIQVGNCVITLHGGMASSKEDAQIKTEIWLAASHPGADATVKDVRVSKPDA